MQKTFPFSLFFVFRFFTLKTELKLLDITILMRYYSCIMLRKLTDTASYDLLALLAALFLAVGMPLIHPVVHSHLEHDHISTGHCDEHRSADRYEDHVQMCTLCDFLATSHWYASGPCRLSSENQPFDTIVSLNDVFLPAACPLNFQSRAPPVFAFV